MDGSKESPIIYFDEDGNGPNEHVCGDGKTPAGAGRIRGWLDRQILIGGVDAKERAIVERLADDMEAGA